MKKGIAEDIQYNEIAAKLDGIAKGKETQEIIERIATELSNLVVSVTGRAYKQGSIDCANRIMNGIVGSYPPENLQ